MRTPTELELHHIAAGYDPKAAHEYYLRTRELKGRRKRQGTPGDYDVDTPAENQAQQRRAMAKVPGLDSRRGKTMEQIHRDAVARQKKQITEQIGRLQDKVNKIEAKIREMEHKEASEDRKGKAKKERAAKEKDKPKSAAEKAKDARENEKYRDKHKQELKNKAKKASKKSGGSSDKKEKKKATVGELRTLATKLKGQIAVAKQKLAAL